MDWINNALGYPFGWLMWLCYKLIPSYGIALLFFTVITKLIMIPLAIKQQKEQVKMIGIQPKLQAVQKKYANDKQKQQEEMMKLQQEEGYNPLSGCLPLLTTMPILFGLINVIYNPLKHILRLAPEVIEKATAISNTISEHTGPASQLNVVRDVVANPAAFAELGENVEKILSLNLNLFGLDLSLVPTFGFSLLMLIPIFSGITSFAISMQSLKSSSAQGQAQNPTMKNMMYIMPLMSLFFTFQVPAGVGLYWIYSNLFAFVQAYFLNKIFNPVILAERQKAAAEAEKEAERNQKIEAKQKKKNLESQNIEVDPETAAKALSQKEAARLKLAEARRKMAEKYGDVYEEDKE